MKKEKIGIKAKGLGMTLKQAEIVITRQNVQIKELNKKLREYKPSENLKMTPETIAKLEQVFALGGTDAEACMYAGITTMTLNKFQRDNPDFLEKKNALKEKPILKARQTIIQNLDTFHGAAWYLERKKRDEFANQQIIKSTNLNINTNLVEMDKYQDLKEKYERELEERLNE